MKKIFLVVISLIVLTASQVYAQLPPPPTLRLEVTRSVTKRDSGGLYSTTFYIRAINAGGSTIPKTTVPLFNMTLSDTRGTLSVDEGGGTHLQSDIGPGQSFEFSFPFRTLTPTGDYIYTITGWQLQDSANRTQSQNVTNTASYRFRVDEQPLPERRPPVLNLNANGVVITPASPRPGDKVTIEGGISNLGIHPALNVISRLELFRDGRKISNWPDKQSARIEPHSGDSIRYEIQNIEAGSYVARFTVDPDGKIVERDKSDNVSETRFLVGFQPGRAAIAVTIEPVGARNAGAQWRVDGGAWQNSGSTLSNVAAGQRSIEYKDIPGWIRPSQESANITAGQTTSLTKNYTLQSGSLQVTIQPNNIAQAGAQWRVGGGPWQASGATVSNLPVGNQTIEFKDVSGWIKPAASNIKYNRRPNCPDRWNIPEIAMQIPFLSN